MVSYHNNTVRSAKVQIILWVCVCFIYFSQFFIHIFLDYFSGEGETFEGSHGCLIYFINILLGAFFEVSL